MNTEIERQLHPDGRPKYTDPEDLEVQAAASYRRPKPQEEEEQ